MMSRATFAYASVVAVVCVGGVAHGDGFRKGPYLQNVSRTGITILWQATQAQAATVTIGGPVNTVIEVPAEDVSEVAVSKLKPATSYQYTVKLANGDVRHGAFATAPEIAAPFSFVVYGDTRSNPSAHRRVVERIRAEVPDFLMGTGDMVSDGSKEGDWQGFFDIEGQLLAENVLYPSIGNHDRQGRGRTADGYRSYFALPENSPDPERYYAFTYSNSRFVVLDSNAYSFALTDQSAWLEEQLSEAAADPLIKHVFVVMHHPPFSVSLHGGHDELRAAWTPLFERYKVSAVFSGHDHVYSRAQRAGVRYFVTGGGGAPLYPRRRQSSADEQATRYFERVNHYMGVRVFGDLVEIVAKRADGSLIETVSWGSQPVPEPDLAAEPLIVAALPLAVEPENPHTAKATGVLPQRRFGLLSVVGLAIALVAGSVLALNLRRNL